MSNSDESGRDRDRLGPTGDFPRGKLNRHDEGGLRLGLGVRADGTVMIDFGTPVRSIGMSPRDAAEMGSKLIKAAIRGWPEAYGEKPPQKLN